MVEVTQAMQESWNSQSDAINSWGELSGEEQSNLATFYQAAIAEGRRQMREEAAGVFKSVFLHGHSEGWTGNQGRRDVQHIDAEKSWSLYVENGALEKTIVRAIPIGDE